MRTHFDYESRDGQLVPIGADDLRFRLIVHEDEAIFTGSEFQMSSIEDVLDFLEVTVRNREPTNSRWIRSWTMVAFGFNVIYSPEPNFVLRYYADYDLDEDEDDHEDWGEVTYTLQPLTPDAAWLLDDAYRSAKHGSIT